MDPSLSVYLLRQNSLQSYHQTQSPFNSTVPVPWPHSPLKLSRFLPQWPTSCHLFCCPCSSTTNTQSHPVVWTGRTAPFTQLISLFPGLQGARPHSHTRWTDDQRWLISGTSPFGGFTTSVLDTGFTLINQQRVLECQLSTDCQNICFESGITALCLVQFSFLLLFLSEKFQKLCFGNRQRLHQRRLQELEKQLEHRDRALQHMALLQAAGAERSRKESFLTEEEKRKASQRLQFLKTRRLQREELQAERSERSFEQEKERLVRAIAEMVFLGCCISSNGTIQSVCRSAGLYPVYHM